MATNRDVQDFFELRQGFQGMSDFADAALRFLDRNGIALATRANGHGTRKAATLREKVKRHYKKRRKQVPMAEISAAVSSANGSRRQFSATVLDALDTTEPRQPIAEGMRVIGALVRRGYAKKVGDEGYIRTTKEFQVEKPKAHAGNGNGSTGEKLLTVQQAAKALKISDSYVRMLAKRGALATRTEMHVPKGRTKAVPTVLLTRDEVQRYKAERNA